MSNRFASFGPGASPAEPRKYGGHIPANSELPIDFRGGDYFLIDGGPGTINTLPPAPTGHVARATVWSGTPTLVNSASLIVQGGANYTLAVGDHVIFFSDGSGVWRAYVMPLATAPVRIGTNVEAWSAALDALGALSSIGLVRRTGSNTFDTPALAIYPQGRLSLASGTPVMTADVSGATTVYWCLYGGSWYPWYDGTEWTLRSIAELSLALDSNSGHTGYQQSGKNFDLFLFNDGGTDRLVTGPAWSSDTSRGTGAGTTQLQQLNGIWTNAVSMTAKFDASSSTKTVAANQGTYVGTMRATANGQTSMVMNPAAASGGALATCSLWNNYNQVFQTFLNIDNGALYTYSSATIRQARASTANQVNFVSGLQVHGITVDQYVTLQATANLGSAAHGGFGLDSTATFYQGAYVDFVNPAATVNYDLNPITRMVTPQIGYHFISRNEASDGTHANTFNVVSNDYLIVGLWC